MTGLRPRGAATTAAIESAALDLALEHGYDRVTVDAICKAVGVSQRTFFNHFPTKDDALLGRELPRIDERAARRFVLSEGQLLVDAISLLDQTASRAVPLARISERVQIISKSPPLLARQMERMSVIEDELRDIIMLRVRHQHPRLTEAEAADLALMVTQLLAGIMRFVASCGLPAETDPRARTAHARDVLSQVLADSRPIDGDA